MAEKPEIPGYTILEPLGEGGMAMVYLAVQENFQRQVAVKVLSARLLSDPSFGVRFLREARIVAQLSHQNIVPVFDVGQHGDCHYIAMELLKGGDLKQRLAKGLPLSECLVIVEQIASALHYAASKNFVHRDIKPENVLFREDGSAVVSDFGIARSTESETNMTLTGTIIGTPSYMSPEQAQALPLDGRSDLYSLGIILFEMLTGNVPYTADSAISIGLKHITDAIPELPDEVAEFQEIIDKALAKSPEDRFQTGQEFIEALDDLEHHLQGGSASTTIITPEALKRHKSAAGRRRISGATSTARARTKTGGNRSRTMSTKNRPGVRSGGQTRFPRGAAATESGFRKSVLAASIVGILAVAGGAGWWFATDDSRSVSSSDAEVGAFSEKTMALLRQANKAVKDGRWYEPSNNSAQYYFTTALALAPQNQEAISGIESLIASYLDRAQKAIAEGDEEKAIEWLNRSSQIAFYASDQSLLERQQALRGQQFQMQQKNIRMSERQSRVDQLLAEAKKAIDDNKLSSPPGDNAYDKYQAALALDPDSQIALDGISTIAAAYLAESITEAQKDNFVRARALIAAAIQIDSQHPDMQGTQLKINELEELKRKQAMALQQEEVMTAAELQQEKENARKVRAQQVAALLAEAEQDLQEDRLQSPIGNNAVEKFRQVLQLEPSNLDALEGLQKVGEKYVVLANASLGKKEIDQANDYLNIAQKLVPNSQQLFVARRSLLDAKEQRAREIDLQMQRDRQVKNLLAAAEKDMAAGRLSSPLGNNALEKYSQVLAVDTINNKASTGRNQIVNALVADINQAIKKSQFDDAEGYIATLARFFPNGSKTRSLKSDLYQAKQQYARLQQEKNDLLGRADKLSKKPTSENNNNQLRTMYSRILAIEPTNSVAKAGLMKTSDYDLGLVNAALKNRNYKKADEVIATVIKVTPQHPALSSVKKALEDAKSAAQTADKSIALAEKEYAKTTTLNDNLEARNALKAAYRNILTAKQADPTNPLVAKSLTNLENKYVEVIRYYTENESFKRGGELIADAMSMDFSKSRISEQQKILQEKEAAAIAKKKRMTRQMGVF
ncbi:MAG: protein kinase [Spongiibacteraceae bacterium]